MKLEQYLQFKTHKESATIKKYCGGLIIKRTMTVTISYHVGLANKFSSSDVYFLGIKIWHQEEELCNENGAIKALQSHQDFPVI